MENIHKATLGDMCDQYFDPRHCETGGTRTRFFIESCDEINDCAKLALNVYNQKTHKNFNLEEIVKLNVIASAYFCMTFRALIAETKECCLFRGVVYVVGGLEVLLCDMKEDNEISIPAGHDEYYEEESPRSVEDISHYTWYSASKNHTLTCSSFIFWSFLGHLHIFYFKIVFVEKVHVLFISMLCD